MQAKCLSAASAPQRGQRLRAVGFGTSVVVFGVPFLSGEEGALTRYSREKRMVLRKECIFKISFAAQLVRCGRALWLAGELPRRTLLSVRLPQWLDLSQLLLDANFLARCCLASLFLLSRRQCPILALKRPPSSYSWSHQSPRQ